MKKGTFVWISRHPLSDAQRKALKDRGFATVVEAGDADAFSAEALGRAIITAVPGGDVNAVGVVHPAAALILKNAGFTVAISRNVNRAPEGERPQFEFSGWEFF